MNMSAWLIAILVLAYVLGGILTVFVRYFTKGWNSESSAVERVVFLFWPPFLFVEVLGVGVAAGQGLASIVESKVDKEPGQKEVPKP